MPLVITMGSLPGYKKSFFEREPRGLDRARKTGDD
jgi:hypothetical protein